MNASNPPRLIRPAVIGVRESPESNTLNPNPTPPVSFASLSTAFAKAQNTTCQTQLAAPSVSFVTGVCESPGAKFQHVEPNAARLAVNPWSPTCLSQPSLIPPILPPRLAHVEGSADRGFGKVREVESISFF